MFQQERLSAHNTGREAVRVCVCEIECVRECVRDRKTS